MGKSYPALQKLVDESARIVFFGGAGVSTESGISDFRSVDGLYHQKFDHPPETILSHSFFLKNPDEFFRFHKEKMCAPHIQPNPAHIALARLEQAGKLLSVVTQNIDGLHQMAGSERVWELHGSSHRNDCMKCAARYSMEEILAMEGTPRCKKCGGIIKPDVVLYEEPLDDEVVQGAVRDISRADLLIVGGTSLVVYPAASLIHYFKGEHLVLLNRDPTPADSLAELVIRDPIGEVLGSLQVG